jgi:hypothetical protein
MAARLSALRASGSLPPPPPPPREISVRVRVNFRAIVRLEVLGKLKKIQITSSEILDIVPQPTTLMLLEIFSSYLRR